MNLQKSLDRILELFLIFQSEVRTHNRVQRFDINRLSEDVLIPVFKDVFNCQFLRNLNREQRNYPGIDLGDDQTRIAFQVTSESDIEKIKDTLRKVVTEKHYLKYETIYIYLLTEKQKRYSKKPLSEITTGYFTFNPEKHIIDSSDLIEIITTLDYELIQRVEQTLEVHFAQPGKYFLQPQITTKTESLTLNMMPITFPDELFIGKVNYERLNVIQNSWEREFKIQLDSGERIVARAALEQKGLKFSSDWVVRSGEIITFHNLRNEELPISKIVESSTVDPIPVKRYISKDGGELDVDHINILKELLRTTLQAQLSHRGIIWQNKDRLFIFTCPENKNVRKEVWSRGTKGGRIVCQKVRRRDDRTKVRFHQHLAFEASFDLYENQWYLAIKPDWFCSYDGYNKSEYWHKNRISYLKRNTWNINVYDLLEFIAEILHKDQEKGLIKQDLRPRITLGELIKLDGAPPISDHEWQQEEEKKKLAALTAALTAKGDLPLFESDEA